MLTFSFGVIFLAFTSTALAQSDPVPNVPWIASAQFDFQPQLSDEFDGTSLDENKWDPHGVRNPNTGCPKWNGPIHSNYPDDSTYYPTTTDPETKQQTVRMFEVKDGYLQMKVQEQPLSFFTQREYYCNATTFTCNHSPSLDCFATDFNGNPIYKDSTNTQYKAVVHDKCKTEPYCIPHPVYVSGKTEADRQYYRLASTHLTSKNSLQYGYMETKVHLGDTPTVAAVWMHDDNTINGYCRYRRSEGPVRVRIECPSLTRSRRWQEIDLMEAMNSTRHYNRYIPNIHSFAMYKGEFSSANAREFSNPGGMGGGPIIVRDIFRQQVPDFSDVPANDRTDNDWHWNPGAVHTLDAPWAAAPRVLGVYWSPKEIRFYVDGKETVRLNNSLIHQPMYLDLSYAPNTRWTMESPTKEQLEEVAKIDYVRTWKVLTIDGVDAPADPSNDLRFDMVEEFDNWYGNKELGVFNRFPVNDSLEIFPPEAGRTAATAEEKEIMEEVRRHVSVHADYVETECTGTERMSGGGRYSQAGGRGNTGRIRRPTKMSARMRDIVLANSERAADVYHTGEKDGPTAMDGQVGEVPPGTLVTQQDEDVEVAKIEEPERSVFDDNNPNDLAGGFAMLDRHGRTV